MFFKPANILVSNFHFSVLKDFVPNHLVMV
uniref:Uncharacterized protein n=1 Tax=Rhizophora mucronata TaxID=61149 RepID=A0A2P2PG41_RHIMU